MACLLNGYISYSFKKELFKKEVKELAQTWRNKYIEKPLSKDKFTCRGEIDGREDSTNKTTLLSLVRGARCRMD